MAVSNTIAKANPTGNMVEYDSNGETVKLSPTMIRQYLVRGNGEVSDQEVMMFLSLCKFQHLNPFLNEAYLIKFGNYPATIVTGKDTFTKRAYKNPNYAGKQAGIIVQDKSTGALTEREGTFYIPDAENLVGGWAKVFIKGYDKPEYAAVSFGEYAGRTKDGALNSQWATKPGTMIRKVALVQALREAFPEDYEGLYSPEEISTATDIVFADTSAGQIAAASTPTDTQKIESKAEPPKAPVEETAEDILFK